jgi:hypothetical protein
LDDYPTENTVTVNLTHQQLDSLDPPFSRLVAIAPSRYQEGTLSPINDPRGYDIKLETVKEIVFQHKSPDNTVVRDGKQWLNYSVDMRQIQILFHRYNPREAFYALPATPQHRHIRDGLRRTIFVDVWPMYTKYLETGKEISRIYVEYTADPNAIPSVRPKFNSRRWKMDGGPYWELRTSDRIYDDAMTWKPIETELKGCRLGLPIRGVDEYPYRETEGDLPGFHPEYAEDLHHAYRDHLKKQHALYRYDQREDRDAVFEWILRSLSEKLQSAYQQDWHIGGLDIEFREGRPRELLQSGLDDLAEGSHSPSHYIRDVQRCVMEKGDEAVPHRV